MRVQCDRPLELGCKQKEICSVHHLLQLLHGQSTDSLRSRLRLEHAWLLGERIDTLASRGGRLLLQLQVQATAKLEGTILLQLGSSQLHVSGDDGLDVLVLQSGLLCYRTESCRGSHRTAGLHGLHCWSNVDWRTTKREIR